MIRVGLVGLGGISKVHLDAYRELDTVKLVAAADVAGEGASRYDIACELGAKIYKDVDEMLAAEEIDMLDICTPTPLHSVMVEKALKAGIHVLSEKPMCRTSDECERMIELSKEGNALYMVAHVVRFMKPYAYLRSLVESGELGKPVHFMFRRLSPVPRWSYEDWMLDLSQSGGSPLDLSIHDLDYIYSVFGEPRAVTGSYRAYQGKEGYAANDYISSELIYDGFSVNVLGAFYDAEFPFTADYLAIFERGRVELKGGKVYKCGEEINLDDAADAGKDSGINISGSSAYTDEIAYFASCITEGKRPEFVSPESSLGSVKLVERILDSVIRI